MKLTVFSNIYSIHQFKPGSTLPSWIYSSDFYSITRTRDELSVVTAQTGSELKEVKTSEGWKILKIQGPLDFSIVGVISEISGILKKKGISLFVISTYETDFLMVKKENVGKTCKALEEEGHIIEYE